MGFFVSWVRLWLEESFLRQILFQGSEEKLKYRTIPYVEGTGCFSKRLVQEVWFSTLFFSSLPSPPSLWGWRVHFFCASNSRLRNMDTPTSQSASVKKEDTRDNQSVEVAMAQDTDVHEKVSKSWYWCVGRWHAMGVLIAHGTWFCFTTETLLRCCAWWWHVVGQLALRLYQNPLKVFEIGFGALKVFGVGFGVGFGFF